MYISIVLVNARMDYAEINYNYIMTLDEKSSTSPTTLVSRSPGVVSLPGMVFIITPVMRTVRN